MAGTPFAVATPKQAQDLTHFFNDRPGLVVQPRRYWENGWIASDMSLTDAGMVAMKLRQILGPDRNLTKAGARAILRENGTHATRVRLMEDGLRRRSFRMGAESPLTEDGQRIVQVLIKYNVEV